MKCWNIVSSGKPLDLSSHMKYSKIQKAAMDPKKNMPGRLISPQSRIIEDMSAKKAFRQIIEPNSLFVSPGVEVRISGRLKNPGLQLLQ